MEKRAQVTMFIIIAVIIVGAILLFLLFRSGIVPNIGGGAETNPKSFLEFALEENIRDTLALVSHQGGYVSNKLNKTFKFEAEPAAIDISYLCYNQNYYYPCVNQEPMLIQHLKSEIHDEIETEVRAAFDDLANSLDKQGYAVDARYRRFGVELMPKSVVIKIDAELTTTKSGEVVKKQDFEIVTPSRFYDIAIVVQEIVAQEGRFCNFEQTGFMLLYPEFEIDKFRTGDSTTIYTVTHRESKEWFRFAVRSCVIPPGF